MPIQKLTEQEKKEILNLQGKMSARDIANQYDISFKTVYNVWNSQPKENTNSQIYIGIIKKMIPAFVDKGLKIKFDSEEIPILQELVKEVFS